MIKYREEQTFHPALFGLLLLLIVIIGVLDYQLSKPALADYTIVIVELFLIFILANFYKLRINITDASLEFGFGIFKKKILRKNIVSCKPFDIKFGQYFGLGIRLGWNRTILYNTRFGKAVRIKVRGKKMDYAITSNNPKRFCTALKGGSVAK